MELPLGTVLVIAQRLDNGLAALEGSPPPRRASREEAQIIGEMRALVSELRAVLNGHAPDGTTSYELDDAAGGPASISRNRIDGGAS